MTAIHLRAEYWAVGYTNYDKDFQIVGKYLNYKTRFGRGYSCILPPGSWQIICLSKDIIEEQAIPIVGEKIWGGFAGHIHGYYDYELIGCDIQPFPTAIESLYSLLRSKKLNQKQTLILKKLQ